MNNPTPNHEPKIIDREDSGWLIYEYRGATFRCQCVHNQLLMPGHPYDSA
jgi:hypothetical protein